jgi:hypothetical protein
MACYRLSLKQEENYRICSVCSKRYYLKKSRKSSYCSIKCKNSLIGRQILNQKIEKSCLSRYGVSNCFQSEQHKEKAKITNLKKYGVENVANSIELNEKRKLTNLEKYGSENVMRSSLIKSKVRSTFKKNYYNTLVKRLELKQIVPNFNVDYFVKNTSYSYKCKACNQNFESEFSNDQHVFCPSNKCKCKSIGEQEIFGFVNSLVKNIECNKRFYGNNGRMLAEIDVFLPDYNFGIEYCGLYWHSELFRDKKYHYEKWAVLNKLGITVVQVFEHEWNEKKEIVKSIISNYLGKSFKIHARNCLIKEITNKEYENFCIENHIQGYASAKVRIGLFYEDRIIEAISFNKKGPGFECIRLCTKLNHSVIGGFSKLLRHFIKNYNPNSIFSYINLRFFSGAGYLKNGFKELGITNPGYFYTSRNRKRLILSRQKCQKKKLAKFLETYDSELSEHDNMINNKFFRVYDAGNLRVKWVP